MTPASTNDSLGKLHKLEVSAEAQKTAGSIEYRAKGVIYSGCAACHNEMELRTCKQTFKQIIISLHVSEKDFKASGLCVMWVRDPLNIFAR